MTFSRSVAAAAGYTAYPDLDPSAGEPVFADLSESREHRKRRTALAYRVFGALHYGSLGDGHITARDPERLDHFWLARNGVPFNHVTVDDLVLVAPDGRVVEGRGWINPAAYFIHHPVHESRPDIVSAAHTHTPYGTPFAAQGRLLQPISQESCTFYDDHALFDDGEVDISSTDGGKRIAATMGGAKAVILRNHGLLTVGASVDSAVGFFLQMERAAEVHVKVPNAQPIDDEAARYAYDGLGGETTGWQLFQWLLRTLVPDPTVVG